jgi:hypothetical protein
MVVMYLTYLQYWAKIHEEREITFDLFCERIFPLGFPKEEDLHNLWNNQKVRVESGSDNLLDYSIALTSIQFTK